MRIGIDVGGTKIEAIALANTGAVVARQRVATPRGEYDGTLRVIHSLVTAMERAAGESGTVGVGIPGAISPATGLVKNSNSTWMNGRPLAEDLERRLERPVRLANDANCFALSEASDGAAAGAGLVFGVIIGTGTGGGVVVNGEVLRGGNAIAGEWGHNPLPWARADEYPGAPCYCGRRGCIETFLSGAGFSADLLAATGRSLTAEQIAAAADEGDTEALQAFDRYVDRFARALASIINVLDPDVIVVGGGLSNMTRLYAAVPQRWGAYVFSDAVATRLVRAAHGDSSGVRGAAWLWPAVS